MGFTYPKGNADKKYFPLNDSSISLPRLDAEIKESFPRVPRSQISISVERFPSIGYGPNAGQYWPRTFLMIERTRPIKEK